MNIHEGLHRFRNELVILCLPLVLFALNRDWFLSDNPFWKTIDPWVYHGYFLQWEEYVRVFGATYYGDRVAWVLPGYLVHHLFPHLAAHYLLHIVFFTITILSYYLILKYTLNKDAAFYSALLFGFYPAFLGWMGSNYVCFPVVTYFLLAFLFLTLSTRASRKYLFLAAGGMSCAAMLYSNMFSALFLPSLIAWYYVKGGFWGRIPPIRDYMVILIGGLVLTGLLSLCQFLITGTYDFVSGTFGWFQYYTVLENPWYKPVLLWLPKAYYLIFPAIIAAGSVAALVILVLRNKIQDKPYSSFLIANYIWISGIFFILNFIIPNPYPILQYNFYAYYLIPFAFLAMAALLSTLFQAVSDVRFLAPFVFILLILPVTLPEIFVIPGLGISAIYIILFFAVSWIGVIILTFFWDPLSSGKILVTAAVLLLVLSMAILNAAVLVPGYISSKQADSRETGYIAVIDAVQAIDRLVPDGNWRFWYDINEKKDGKYYGSLFNAVNANYLWGFTWINIEFPALDEDSLARIPDPKESYSIVILSADEDAFYKAQQAFAGEGYHAILKGNETIEKGGIRFDCVVVQIGRMEDGNVTG